MKVSAPRSTLINGQTRVGSENRASVYSDSQTDTCEDSLIRWVEKEKNPTFRLEGEVAELADVRPDVGVRSDVFLQHAGFLAADAALLADVLPPAATTNVNVVLIGFVPGRTSKWQRLCGYVFLSVFFLLSSCVSSEGPQSSISASADLNPAHISWFSWQISHRGRCFSCFDLPALPASSATSTLLLCMLFLTSCRFCHWCVACFVPWGICCLAPCFSLFMSAHGRAAGHNLLQMGI